LAKNIVFEPLEVVERLLQVRVAEIALASDLVQGMAAGLDTFSSASSMPASACAKTSLGID